MATDNVFTCKEYIEREAALDALQNHYAVRNAVQNGIMDECVMLMMRVPAADVVARDCFNKILAENDDMRAIIDTYGGLENIQSAFVKLHEIETADVRPVERGKWTRHDYSPIGHDYQCSECGWNNDMATRFCPHCGALMDKDGDGE